MQPLDNEKAFARQKFRSSRSRGRRGGYARGGHHGGPGREVPSSNLESNYFRYEDESEQDGVVVPKSQGADLETLLKEAEVQFNQAFYRLRSQLQDITDEAPPLGATNPDQLLAIDLQQLSASLAPLPLHALLGLEPEYLEGVDLEEPPGQAQQVLQGQQGHRQQGQQQLPAQTLPAAAVALPLKPRETYPAAAVAAAVSVTAASAPPFVPVPLTAASRQAPPAVPVPVPVAAPPPSALAALAVDGSADDHHDDDDLEALLLGRPAAARPVPGAVPAVAARVAGPAVPPVLAAALAAARQRISLSSPNASAAAPAVASVSDGAAGERDRGACAAGPVTAAAVAAVAAVTGSAAKHAQDDGRLEAGGRPAGLESTRVVFPAATATGRLPGMTGGVTPTGIGGVGGAGVVRLAPYAPPSPTAAGTAITAVAQRLTAAAMPAAPAVVSFPAARLGGLSAAAPAQRVNLPVRASGGSSSTAAPVPAPFGGSGGDAGGAVVDAELRLLLGLPAMGPASGPAAARAPTAVSQVQGRPAAKPVGGQPVRPGPAPPAAVSAQSLDDWLNGL